MRESKQARRFSREFKLAAIQRVQKGEMQAAVSRDLQIAAPQLAKWRQQLRLGGEATLREPGRPAGKGKVGNPGRETRTGQLERLVGQQQAAIDFLEQALHRVEELRRKKKDDGATASSE
jgi:transposase